MSKRTVDPKKITTLRDWAARWPGAGNLGFDPETREPAVFSIDGDRKLVTKIPWIREGDTMTILSQPTRFSQQAVGAAIARYGKIREQRTAFTAAAADQLRTAEGALLEAWRAYRAAPPAARDGLRRDILTAEKAINEIEEALAAQIYKGRAAIEIALPPDGAIKTYVPPIPLERRGIPMTAVAGGAASAGSSE